VANAVPVPRAKPQIATTLQLASADAQLVPAVKPRQAAADKNEQKPEPRPQTPADIINARGFWGDIPASPKQATPEQIAAITARRAVADPDQTASVAAAYNALAYAPPASSPVDRANIVAASAPIPRGVHPSASSRNAAAPATEINTVAAKGVQGRDGTVTTSARIAGARGNDTWLRIVLLTPSVSSSMSVTQMGDTDLTMMRSFFVKPQTAIAMNFSDDPLMGLSCDRFSGSATARLETTSFRTAFLR